MGEISEDCAELESLPVLSLAWQLTNSPDPLYDAKPERFNPKPAVVIRAGSAGEEVLNYLREVGGFKTECQILWVTKRSHSAISWALLCLIRKCLVEARQDLRPHVGPVAERKSSRYKKYRAVRFPNE